MKESHRRLTRFYADLATNVAVTDDLQSSVRAPMNLALAREFSSPYMIGN
jgi:hypothetical protein